MQLADCPHSSPQLPTTPTLDDFRLLSRHLRTDSSNNIVIVDEEGTPVEVRRPRARSLRYVTVCASLMCTCILSFGMKCFSNCPRVAIWPGGVFVHGARQNSTDQKAAFGCYIRVESTSYCMHSVYPYMYLVFWGMLAFLSEHTSTSLSIHQLTLCIR